MSTLHLDHLDQLEHESVHILREAASQFGHACILFSGGKDSLALWDLLLRLGHRAEGLYLGLGIGDYSDVSGQYARRFAEERGLVLHEVDLRRDYGYDVPTAAAATRRVPCSACGLSKRHLFDEVARRGDFDVVATGHNLDDEAAVLFGNTLRWDVEYLSRQLPVLPARHGFPRKVDRKSTRLNSSHIPLSRMPSSA